MLCQHCQKKPAVLSYLVSMGNQQKELQLCQDCLEELMREDLGISKIVDEGLGGVLSAMLEMMIQDSGEEAHGKECPHCHTTWKDFKDTGLLGCSQCYQTFGPDLNRIIKQFHGQDHHQGEIPQAFQEEVYRDRQIMDLKAQLDQAVQEENYEKAADLRDQINGLKEQAHESN